MSRPTPRKSSLAGANPVAPPTAQPIAPSESQIARPTKGATTTAKTTRQTKYPPKVSFYQAPEDTARVRGAILHTQVSEGTRSLSQFVNDAVMAEVERLEAKYNAGQPFPPVGARELPQGRPMGE